MKVADRSMNSRTKTARSALKTARPQTWGRPKSGMAATSASIRTKKQINAATQVITSRSTLGTQPLSTTTTDEKAARRSPIG